METTEMKVGGMTCGGCVQGAIRSGRGEAAIDELLVVVEKFAR